MALAIEQSVIVKATLLELWHALTDADELENWWSEDVTLQPKVGGKFEEKWEDDEGQKQMASGKVVAVKKAQMISFTWKEKSWPGKAETLCEFEVQEMAGGKCSLKLRHSGWESLPEATREKIQKEFKIGWGYHLKELKSYLDE